VVALGLRYSGLEHQANAAIESKVSWTADPELVQATEHMEHGKLDEAIATLKSYVAKKPDSIDAYTMLQQISWRKNDIPAYREAIIKLCQLHLKAQDLDAAWQSYEEYTNSGGDPIPAPTWLELCRAAEGKENYDRAVAEYEKLASAYPTQKQSLLALMAAGRLSLKKLNRASEAVRFYEAAAKSRVPHLDWDSNIQAGLQDARKALTGSEVSALKS
jgi:tetratricopeptide (TPR) repeat protein